MIDTTCAHCARPVRIDLDVVAVWVEGCRDCPTVHPVGRASFPCPHCELFDVRTLRADSVAWLKQRGVPITLRPLEADEPIRRIAPPLGRAEVEQVVADLTQATYLAAVAGATTTT